jgi:23S rRNA pseudouridine2605 synthase
MNRSEAGGNAGDRKRRDDRRRPPERPATPARRPVRITSRRTHAAAETNADAPAPGRPRPDADDDGRERLQKVLAGAGLGSRRACEELITSGRVEVDRQVVTELGSRVDPHAQEIRVDGERLPNPKRVVFLLNKPVGVVTTNFDPAGRPRVVDLVPGDQRLFAIGRLDRMSEGLILVTNDGGLANLLAHPRYGVEKKYLVQVAGVPSEELLESLRRGVRLAEGEVHAKRVSIRSQHKLSAVLEMVLDEGKNREIRRMLARLGHKVHQLKRVAVGRLSLGNLLPGQWRQLAWSEIEDLRRDAIAAVGPDAEREPTRPDRGPRRGRPFSPRGGERSGRPGSGRPGSGRPGSGRPGSGRPGSGRPGSGRPGPGRPGPGRPGSGRPGSGRPGPGGDEGPPRGRPGKFPAKPGKKYPAGSTGDRGGQGLPTTSQKREPAGGGTKKPGGAKSGPLKVPGPVRRKRPGKASSWRKQRPAGEQGA